MRKIGKKTICIALALTMLASGCLTGCNSGNATSSDTVSSGTQSTGSSAGEKDSQKISIEIMSNAWVGTARGNNDPYKAWLDKTFNVDAKLTASTNFKDQIMVRVSSGDVPDIIAPGDKNLMLSLYDEGVLLDDWNKYKKQVPTIFKEMNETAQKGATVDGKLAFISQLEDQNDWSWKIRKDWLHNLGLKTPTTPEELLDVARKFTNNDPDKDGKNDTYAFTSAGGKTGVGEINELGFMWGPVGFYLGDDKKVNNWILDGNCKKWLDYMREIVKEKLIDPDWYTIGWEDRKPKLFKGTYGICWYPSVIVGECEGGTGATGKTVGWWEDMPTPKGSETGGIIGANNPYASMRTISADAEKDPDKLDRLLQIFESVEYPNKGYYQLRWGVDCDKFVLKDAGDGYKFINSKTAHKGINQRLPDSNQGLWDWGCWIGCGYADKVLETGSDEMDDACRAQLNMIKTTASMKKMSDANSLFTFDNTISTQLSTIEAAFEYKYINGQTDDYSGFQKNWLGAGGQKLLDAAQKQAKTLGLTK